MPSQLTYENDGIVVVHGDALDLLDAAVAILFNLFLRDSSIEHASGSVTSNDRWDSDDAYATWCKRWLPPPAHAGWHPLCHDEYAGNAVHTPPPPATRGSVSHRMV